MPSPACAKVLDEVFASVGRKGSKSASVSAKDTVAGSSVANFLGEPGPVLEDFVSGPESISNGQGEYLISHGGQPLCYTKFYAWLTFDVSLRPQTTFIYHSGTRNTLSTLYGSCSAFYRSGS